MSALFEIGEPVILCSKMYPELNAECVVLDVVGPDERIKRAKVDNVRFAIRPTGFAYLTTIANGLERFNSNGEVFNNMWAQVSLRKKQEPSNQNLESLISELNLEPEFA